MTVKDEDAQGTPLAVVSTARHIPGKNGRDQPKPSAQRACDACFMLKEKCIRLEESKTCQRCRRLGKTCLANRPVKPPGRRRLLPPARTGDSHGPTTAAVCTKDEKKLPYCLNPFGVLFKELKPMEEFMVREFINPSNFTRLMVMPRIGITMHKEAVQTFLHHYDDLRDGCFSMYGAFASAMDMSFPGFDKQANLTRANSALKRFSTLPCPETQDEFARWVWLGLTVVIFAHCALGSAASPVRRTILAHTVALGERGREMRRHPLVVSFTTLDILESLVYRQRPVADLDEGCVVGLESFPGLASPLIRFLYRLCLISICEAGDDSLNELEAEVEIWQPEVDPADMEACSTTAASHLLTRTRVHKSAILLYIHRLRHPFGEDDSKATSLATSIISDLDLATATTKQPPDWVTLPCLFASVEAGTAKRRAKAINDVDKYFDSISPKARAMAKQFLRALWELRDDPKVVGDVELVDSAERYEGPTLAGLSGAFVFSEDIGTVVPQQPVT